MSASCHCVVVRFLATGIDIEEGMVMNVAVDVDVYADMVIGRVGRSALGSMIAEVRGGVGD